MSDGRGEGGDRGEAVLAIFQRGADFTREILAENERLRGRINDIETRQHEAAQSPGDWEKLRYELINRIESLEAENRDIMEQLKAVEGENQQFADRYIEIEEENNNLANLYVASYQLHSTLDPSEVLRVIVEIVINLIGAEIFCVYVCQDDSPSLEPVASERSMSTSRSWTSSYSVKTTTRMLGSSSRSACRSAMSALYLVSSCALGTHCSATRCVCPSSSSMRDAPCLLLCSAYAD